MKNRALELLRTGTGNKNAEFREGQLEAINDIIQDNGRLLLVQKTGWGKSFVYFIATKILREQNKGIALLISPLLSLMRNQISAANKMGLVAETINSTNNDNWEEIEKNILHNKIDLLLISPERLNNEQFIKNVLSKIANNISLLIIDEAHCISDWGHDFRPDYRLISRIIKNLPPNFRLLATTATANNRVMQDLQEILGNNIKISRGDLTRNSLFLQTIKLNSQKERMAWLVENLPKINGSGIIYTLTVRDAEYLAEWLKLNNINAEHYTSESNNREELENKLLNNQLKCLVATVALGMGFDKPDLAFVIHYQMPSSVISYYQQIGRAGRNLDSAYVILLSGEEEIIINEYFINSAFPSREEVDSILTVLKNNSLGLSINELKARLNLKHSRIDNTLKLLLLETPAPLVKNNSKYVLTAVNLSEDFWNRVERITNLRKRELKQMQEFLELPFGEHMKFLISALDGDISTIKYPNLNPLTKNYSLNLLEKAKEFSKRKYKVIEVHKKLPVGVKLPKYGINSSTIIDIYQNEEGRSLSIWGIGDLAKLAQKGKYFDNRFADELVKESLEFIQNWNISIDWICCIPSLRRPNLVSDFAQRLAKKLNLPFYEAISKVISNPEQKQMENSAQQVKNLDGVFEINSDIITRHNLTGTVLLVDDFVDSGWTFAVVGYLLRQNGIKKVYPFALSYTGKK